MFFFIKKYTFIIIILFVHLFTADKIHASEDAEIHDLILSKNNNSLFLSFTITNAFSKKIKDIIQSSIPVIFSFDIEINKKRKFFPDKEIYEKEIIHKLKYSSLTKIYFLKKPYISEEPYLINSKKKAFSEMVTIRDFKLDAKLAEGSEYIIRVRARLQEITLPLYLHKIFFFLSAWDFKTDWYELDLKI
ncbi:MAG: hypothetical protein CSA18_00095 [Deltaproteobacteria bacterium]|nr:MAG: hypothetical protein CSA18_00095 [Deltaproteobacteria bacterium]